MEIASIDDDKRDPRRQAWVKYRLRRAIVYQAPAGHCFTDYLDDEDALDPNVEERQLELVRERLALDAARVLGVGCGAGVLLARRVHAARTRRTHTTRSCCGTHSST